MFLGLDFTVALCFHIAIQGGIAMNTTCPFCGVKSGNIGWHFVACNEMPDGCGDKIARGYEVLYSANRNLIEKKYAGGDGIRSIEKETGIPFRVLKRMMEAWGVQLRDVSEAIRLQNQKNKKLFLVRYGVENPFQVPEVIRKIQNKRNSRASFNKARHTMMERYGVDNPFRLDKVKARIKEVSSTEEFKARKTRRLQDAFAKKTVESWRERTSKTEKTNLVRYGVKNPFQIPAVRAFIANDEAGKTKRRNTMVRIGIWKSDREKTDFERYFCAVRSLTRRNRRALFAKWDGTCFYTGIKLITNDEFLKSNPGSHLARNSLRPTVDHKTSVIAGFKTGISPEVVGGIDNLCVCSQRENSRKNYRTLIQYAGVNYVQG